MFAPTLFSTGNDEEGTRTIAASKAVLLLSDFVGTIDQQVRLHDAEMAEVLWGIVDMVYAAVASRAFEENNLVAPADAQWDGSIPVLDEFFAHELTESGFYDFSEMVLAPLNEAYARPDPTGPHPPATQPAKVAQ